MKALSLLQPWATLVAIGAKKIETRSWPTKYRGPLAIHASKGFPPNLGALCYESPFTEALMRISPSLVPVDLVRSRVVRQLPLGFILCVCDLVDCIKITAGNAPPEPERSFGDYSTEPKKRYAWHLANVRALPEPIPAKGSLGLWTPAPDVLEQLERFYRATA